MFLPALPHVLDIPHVAALSADHHSDIDRGQQRKQNRASFKDLVRAEGLLVKHSVLHTNLHQSVCYFVVRDLVRKSVDHGVETNRQYDEPGIVVHHDKAPRQYNRPDVMRKIDYLAEFRAVVVSLGDFDDYV